MIPVSIYYNDGHGVLKVIETTLPYCPNKGDSIDMAELVDVKESHNVFTVNRTIFYPNSDNITVDCF